MINWDVEPIIRMSASSEFLASTPPDHPYRVGVVGNSADVAGRRFRDAMFAWMELHERSSDPSPISLKSSEDLMLKVNPDA